MTFSPMFTRSRMRLVTPCTRGSRKRHSFFRITITRSFWPKMRSYNITRKVDDIPGTVFRQTMFAEFEKIIHAVEESGDALTLDVFKSEYHKLLGAYFAETFTLDQQPNL